LRGYLETGNKKRKATSSDAGAGVEASGLQRTVGTLCADTHPGAYSGQDAYTGRLIPSHWEGGNVHPTLNQSAKGSGGVGSSNQELFSQGGAYLVPGESHIVQASELRLRGQITEQNTCPTLLANTKSGDNDPLAVQAISFQPGNLARRAGSDPSSEVFPTLSKDSGDQNPHVATPMAVRRLTPVECERLQGFPDNWSRISWKGKPEEECPDGPRYKACGNSMAVPVMRWIGERIAAVDSTLLTHA
jgi:DNA (cytosine-5)-methyltransferase 1